ncbi:hypothetical protein K461DRAFT_297921 [Myriangium duriaei CBS 260.36]|uniref:2EXR domain-containing protein n=1 Tax=Myriangium duriaei CBS 260.36 TaxID=1168546 RepID=A0A9P4ITP0_9PEZI|nr:hypothetical protein K461DRAFT_297921 [Myriangium duriaei CBS 260.36]
MAIKFLWRRRKTRARVTHRHGQDSDSMIIDRLCQLLSELNINSSGAPTTSSSITIARELDPSTSHQFHQLVPELETMPLRTPASAADTEDAQRTHTPGFHQFSHLPPELRIKIWKLMLIPCKPVLYRYNPKFGFEPGVYGRLRRLYNVFRSTAGQNKSNLSEFGIGLERLKVTSTIPAALSASYEARAAILECAGRFGQTIQHGPDGKASLVRSFIPGYDVVCLEDEWWSRRRHTPLQEPAFPQDMWDFLFENDGIVAVHKDALSEHAFLKWLIRRTASIYIVFDRLYQITGYREIKSSHGDVWVWNRDERKFDVAEDHTDRPRSPRYGDGDTKFDFMNAKIQSLAEVLVEEDVRTFEMRPISILAEAGDILVFDNEDEGVDRLIRSSRWLDELHAYHARYVRHLEASRVARNERRRNRGAIENV